jgi:hypothetical protein
VTVDEIVAYYIAKDRLTHPDDIAYMREHVEEIAALLAAPSLAVAPSRPTDAPTRGHAR